MKLRSVLLGSAAALCASAVSAEAGNFYAGVLGGLDMTNDKLSHSGVFITSSGSTLPFTGSGKAHDGYFIGVNLGYDLSHDVTPGLRVELEVAKRQNNIHGGGSSFALGVNPIDTDFQQENWSVMANVWYDVDTGTRWKPYIGGGIGWARDKLHGDVVGATNSSFHVAGIANEDSGFAYQLGVGLDVDIRPGVAVGVGYRYFSGPDVPAFAFSSAGGNIAVSSVNDVHQDIEVHVRFGLSD